MANTRGKQFDVFGGFSSLPNPIPADNYQDRSRLTRSRRLYAERRILALFKTCDSFQALTQAQIREIIPITTTTCSRAVCNLTDAGLLVKSKTMIQGSQKRLVHTWTLK